MNRNCRLKLLMCSCSAFLVGAAFPIGLKGVEMASRQEINAAIKSDVLSKLRNLGFSGSFPHLRRMGDEVVDLVTFQFDRHGGALTIEIAKCSLSGIDGPLGHTPAKNATAHHRHPIYRKRLGDHSRSPGGSDNWFSYADRGAASVADAILTRLLDDSIWNDVSPDGSETPYRK
ncbi:DUF4304 domain-containing protein [Rhizobium ruizarguesonis]|nr:DUF4304 domain-containing protein [Rhizobium ruizarguesonis]TAU57086.1 DUF4304 domain-containing protein [Rhizobium ruizarguesonis]TAV01751.1 DUF4304 domain-containing protein [Rhizobium ruizarguesonis]TAV28312.1 DUF4304 domain-containing protein [Rhizobium ruizarguesonis]TAW60373.1 DUF4304 domain-containing protein [Rhizobium ruizarguesonis]